MGTLDGMTGQRKVIVRVLLVFFLLDLLVGGWMVWLFQRAHPAIPTVPATTEIRTSEFEIGVLCGAMALNDFLLHRPDTNVPFSQALLEKAYQLRKEHKQ